MSTHQVTTKWLEGMAFEATNPGGNIRMNDDAKTEGYNEGLRPKAMMLASLGGCTGMDIASLIPKMKIELDTFNIEVEGDLTDEHPKYYHTVRVHYNFFGKNLDKKKLQKIVDLSTEKYCGVLAMFRKFAKIDIQVNFNE